MDIDEIFDTAWIDLISQSCSLANDQGAPRQPEPARLTGRQGCEQVANNSTGVVAVLGRMIPISFYAACVIDEDKKGRSCWKTGCTSKRGFHS